MPTASSILIYGHDPTLLDTRRWVLETAGFEVVTVFAIEAAEQVMTSKPIDLFVLCHTLTAVERSVALSAAATRRPQMRKLSICTAQMSSGAEEIAGTTLDSFAGGEGLIAAAWKLLQ